MNKVLMVLCLAACAGASDDKGTALVQFSGALERLAATVAPAVVQVQVSAWCSPASAGGDDGGVLTSCKVVGSGVIVDPSGYIITNEHVVRNARNIRVMLTPEDHSSDAALPAGKQQPNLDAIIIGANSEPLGKRRVLDAVVIGANRDTDIAVLKINASGLRTIPLSQNARGPRQGQAVLAVGSPQGLENTMTIGIISAVGRQPQPDYPMVYIQTDAAINPGNSGGPLLNVEGELLGINTFIMSETGRNQGLGFAVPTGVVRYVYTQLRAHGVVRQNLVGVQVQTLTPSLAQGLGLSRGYGVLVCDVLPGSPADTSGLRPRDIIATVDGSAISALPYYNAMMYLHDPTVPVAVTVLRGDQTLQFQVPAVSLDDQYYKDTSIDPNESLVAELGIFGRSINTTLAMRNGLRSNTGIYVVATTAGNQDSMELAAGDVIASLNGRSIVSMQELRGAIHEMSPGKAAVLQIERRGHFLYIERQME